MKEVVLNDVHVKLGAKMVPFAGFSMPVQYEGVNAEHFCVRNSVGVFDVSHMGEFIVEGPEALDFLQKVVSNDVSKLVDGKVQYAYFPNATGGVVDDLLVYRFSSTKYMLVVNASNIEKDFDWISSNNTFNVKLTDLSDEYSLFAVQGPKALKVLQTLTDSNLSEFSYYTFKEIPFANKNNVIVSATGYTGAGGFEIYVKNEDAKEVWNAIFVAGASEDIKPIGLAARDTLRLEMGYCLYGNELNDTTSPIAAGLSWVTKFNKDFIAKDIIFKDKTEGPHNKLVAFEILDKGIPRTGYELVDENETVVGEVTSGTMSPVLKKGIGLGYVESDFLSKGEDLYILIRNKKIKIALVKLPFVQPNVN